MEGTLIAHGRIDRTRTHKPRVVSCLGGPLRQRPKPTRLVGLHTKGGSRSNLLRTHMEQFLYIAAGVDAIAKTIADIRWT